MGRQRAANDPSVRTELTERQRQVLRLIARGRTNGQIAEELGLTLDGVKWHVREILTRLGVDCREEAAAWWKRNRGMGERMPSWLGWPLAAGFGGATAVAVAVVFVVGVVIGSPGSDEPAVPERECRPAPGSIIGLDPFCVAWRDRFDDESGFRVTIGYGGGGEVFTYTTEPGTETFFPPDGHAPPRQGTLDECLARSNIQVSVAVIRSDIPEEFARGAVNFECASAAGSPEDPEFISQPELTLAGEGDGWRVYVDEEGGVPHARDAVLAVHWSHPNARVEMVDAATGRVAARWEVGYAPGAVLRAAANELLISDEHWSREPDHRWRLLRFSLDSLDLIEARPMPGRIYPRRPVGWMILSADQRSLFYTAPLYPDCFEQVSDLVRIARDCDRFRVGVLNLDAPGSPIVLANVGEQCGTLSPGLPGTRSARIACRDGQAFTVSADGPASEIVSGPHPRPGLSSAAETLVSDELSLRWAISGGACCTIARASLVRVETGEVVTNAPLGPNRYQAIAPVTANRVLLMDATGQLFHLDFATGERVRLGYAIADVTEQTVLVR
jgi:DNA-binding CsgD family transcriptional regulator